MDYKKAGVDIQAGEDLVHWLKTNKPSHTPHKDRLVSGIGGFAALFRADFPSMESPCLVSATDGVGTKLLLAVKYKSYGTVAQDLVAMCVNDLICTGASPLFFLDYFATGKLNLEAAKEFLTGLREACAEADCMLIGGETAEMPGVYRGDDFDCAGFSVGVVDEPKVLGAHRVTAGDCIIGVASSGFHSNGYSLLRKIFEEDMDDWKEFLLKPTALYVKLAKGLLERFKVDGIHAIANITGGGLDNLTRVLPKGVTAELEAWKIPGPFLEVKRRGQMEWSDLLTTLNCGLGIVLVVDKSIREDSLVAIKELGHEAIDLGRVTPAQSEAPSWILDYSQLRS